MNPPDHHDWLFFDDLQEIKRLAKRGNAWARRKLLRHICIDDQIDAAIRDTLNRPTPDYTADTGLAIATGD